MEGALGYQSTVARDLPFLHALGTFQGHDKDELLRKTLQRTPPTGSLRVSHPFSEHDLILNLYSANYKNKKKITLGTHMVRGGKALL
jgi:hypothetical protein